MNSNFILADVATVRAQIANIKAAYPELEEDADLLADMLEGSTGLHEIATRILSECLDAESLSAAIKLRSDDLKARRDRLDSKSDMLRNTLRWLLEAAGQEKITLPEATISVTKPRDCVEVNDIDALPQGFFKNERKPLSKEILAALKAGEVVPGATLKTGSAGLMIRTK